MLCSTNCGRAVHHELPQGWRGWGLTQENRRKNVGGSACLSPREAPRLGCVLFRLKFEQHVLSTQGKRGSLTSLAHTSMDLLGVLLSL